jgi:inner membrane protein
MDLITQGILGATVAQVGFQKPLGRRALFLGAIVGMLPDLDVIVKFSSNPFAEMLHHRGITHSLWFGPIVGPILGYLLFLFYKKQGKKDSLSAWVGLGVWCLLTHPLLDVFTVYGTQLLAPFSSHRFTIPAISIIDPVYSLTLLASVCIGIFFPNKRTLVTWSAAAALVITSAYIFWGLEQNDKAHALCVASLRQEKKVSPVTVNAYPTMFQLFLRRLVAEDDHALYFGFVSTWAPKSIQWTVLEKPHHLPGRFFLSDPEVKIFTWFTEGHYSISYDSHNHKVIIMDTRYGYRGNTLFGLWGIGFEINELGEKVSPAEKIRTPLDNVSHKTILALFQEAFV